MITIINSITVSLVQAPVWISLLVLIFSGTLESYLGQAFAHFIVGAAISMGVISYFSSWKGVIWIPQSVPVVMLATITADISSNSLGVYSNEALFVTVLAVISISSILTGIVLYLLGKFKLGNLAHQLPFPVTAGFLGGAGCLLLQGSITSSIGLNSYIGLYQIEVMAYWLPAIMLGLLIYVLEQRIRHALLLVAVMILAVIGFYCVVYISDVPFSEWAATGWLFAPLPLDNQFSLATMSQLQQIQWYVILERSGSILLLAMTSAIGMLVFSRGFGLSVGLDLDINKDLRVTGFANTLASLVAGWPGYLSLALSSINAKQGKQLPLTGLLSVLFASVLLYYSTQLLVYIPRFVVSSALAYIGFTFVFAWVLEPLKRLSLLEKGALLLIVLVTTLFGLFEGAVVGALITMLIQFGKMANRRCTPSCSITD